MERIILSHLVALIMPVPVRPRPVVPLPLAEPASYAVHPPPLSHATQHGRRHAWIQHLGRRRPIVPLRRQPWKTASPDAIGGHDSPGPGKVDFLE